MPISIIDSKTIFHPGYTSGDYYSVVGSGFTSNNLISNRIFYIPAIIYDNITIDRLGIEVTNGAVGAQAKLGIYKLSDLDIGKPGQQVTATAFLDCSTSGIKIGVINETPLNPGVYFFAVALGNIDLLVRSVANNAINILLGNSSGASYSTNTVCFSQFASDLPITVSGFLASSSFAPIIRFRIKL